MTRPDGDEAAQAAKLRHDAALAAMVEGVPYIRFLGIGFDRRGDEVTGVLPFREMLVGNPSLPALHGGVTAAFLEVTAIVSLGWILLRDTATSGGEGPVAGDARPTLPRLPRTIDFTVDYLRSGLPRDAYARAEITRSGRRYASVRVDAWQDDRARPIAQAVGHFLVPQQGPRG